MKKKLISIAKGLALLVLVNIAASYLHTRIDLTEDKRYTLSKAAIATVNKFTSPVIVDVLLGDNLPPEFIKLRQETEQILNEFALKNDNVKFNFEDPLANQSESEAIISELQRIGLTPANITTEDNGKVSQELIFPWAMATYGNKTVKIPLLRNNLGATTEERINNSVTGLEFAFADAFSKLKIEQKKKVAVIKGNGELADIRIADYLTTIKEYYNIGAITLDSVATNPQNILDQLKTYDLAIIAKPTEAFTDEEKYVLDQFIVNGGKSIWLIDQVNMELDSLFNEKGTAMATARNLNLKDFFFKYGLRLNPVLVNDLYFTQIVLATGDGNNSQFNPVPWPYHPMVLSKNNHPINNNLEALRFQFTGTIDTLGTAYKKTVLYESSPLSKVELVPSQISLNSIGIPPNKDAYTDGNKALAVLVEGEFNSVFTNRVKPLKLKGVLEKGRQNKMLVIADGDVIKNQLQNGSPLDLSYDKWTSNTYGNKEFMINAINYLLDDDGLINIRNKKVAIPLLDKEKIAAQKTKWQLINIGAPVLLTLLLGFFFNYIRKKKYSA